MYSKCQKCGKKLTDRKVSKEDMDRNVGTALLHIITGILLTGKTTAYLGK